MVFPVKNVSETTQVPQVFDLTNPNDTAAERSKILSEKMADALATMSPDNVEPPIVNPLKLPYFMVATIGKIFMAKKDLNHINKPEKELIIEL